ncbi:N-lysine methyltransferase setd6 isoform X1 [Pyrus x bretschneideri]|uniref:N-lysine methyltransferase setd6 isoform X1 n=1 Tax=Pyrus x bretschneideri TaxID=225117 RepID=UPI00202F5FBB|nr:N-lysine methyltransferase setd6 isoform X1 [Pyrus x bretschneideri]
MVMGSRSRQSSSSGSRRVRAFKRWMKQEGIECSDALELRDDGATAGGMGISVRAVGDLKEEDVVARIPKLACLTIRTTAAAAEPEAAEALENEEELVGLAVALMYERSLGERSRWAPYLELLSEEEAAALPLVWSAQEVEHLLQGTELEAATVKAERSDMRKQWKESVEPLLLMLLNSNSSNSFQFQDYLVARTFISSRSFQIDGYHGIGMVPLADLFNHKTAAEDVHLMTSPQSSQSDSDTPQQTTESASAPSDASCKEDEDEDDDDLEMTMVKDVKLGAECFAFLFLFVSSQVFNTYGPLGNAALLHRYGFTEPDNPYDIVNIDLELILRWGSSFSGQHRRARVSLWKRFHYSGCVTHDYEYFEISFHGQPQFDMLVLLYIMLLPDEEYYKLDLAIATAGGSSDEPMPVDIIFPDKSQQLRHKAEMLTEELLLTKSLCNALSSLADMRDSLYGANSLEDDIRALGRCSCISEKKLYHSLVLRISERKILRKLQIYAANAKEASWTDKLKRK